MAVNRRKTVLASAAYAVGNPAASSTVMVKNDDASGFILVVDVTNINGGGVKPHLRIKSAAGNAKAFWDGAAVLNGNGVVWYLFYPQGAADATNTAGTQLSFQERVNINVPVELELSLEVTTAAVTCSVDVLPLV